MMATMILFGIPQDAALTFCVLIVRRHNDRINLISVSARGRVLHKFSRQIQARIHVAELQAA